MNNPAGQDTAMPEPSSHAGVAEFQWANVNGAHGMALVAALEGQGWVRVRQHPLWPASWLMRKA